MASDEERYRLLFDNHPHPMWVYDRETLRFLEVNEAAVRKYGYSRAEFLGLTLEDIRPAEDLPRFRELLAAPRPAVREWRDWRHRLKDGTLIDVQVTSHTLELAGRPAALVAAVDVTDRKRVERALAESEQQLRFLVERTSAALYRLDFASRRYDYMSPVIERLTGYTVDEINAIGFAGIVLQMNATASSQRLREALSGGRLEDSFGEFAADYRIRRKDGSEGWLADFSRPWIHADGRLLGSIGVLTDITERKQLEAQLLQAQKMEAIGRLAGGIAHDFNNMLGVILGFADLAERRLAPNDPLARHVRNIAYAARRSADLTSRLLVFARRQTVSPRVVDLNAQVASLRNMVARLIGEDVALEFVPSAGLWNVLIDPSQLDQVLANLATNARDAIENVGTVTLRTGNVSLGAEDVRSRPGRSPGDYVQLSVHDTGCGMDAATRERIFEPFFTTKEEGKGTGLGLSTVYGIVEQAGGFIDVESEPGRGTTFRIHLPRCDAPAAAPEAAAAPVKLAGHETLLLVEDEPQLLDLAQESLEDLGYTVLAALAPQEALLLVEQHRGEIHAMVTDVVMPTMNGRDLAERVRGLRPDIRVVFTSGYPASVATLQGILEEGVAFVQKPYRSDALAAKLREVLDA